MNPSRATMFENSDFMLRFFQTSATERLPSVPAFTCNSTQPALKLAARNTRSPSSTTGCAHLGHLLFAQAYSQRMRPSSPLRWPCNCCRRFRSPRCRSRSRSGKSVQHLRVCTLEDLLAGGTGGGSDHLIDQIQSQADFFL